MEPHALPRGRCTVSFVIDQLEEGRELQMRRQRTHGEEEVLDVRARGWGTARSPGRAKRL